MNAPPVVRLPDVLQAVALAVDLAPGHPVGHAIGSGPWAGHSEPEFGAGPPHIAPLHDAELDAVLGMVADWVDLRSPFVVGHSRAVAELAGSAADWLGLDRVEVDLVRRAGLVHDIGRLTAPDMPWDSTDPLTLAAATPVRLHSYYTGGHPAADQPATTRVLAAADCYRTGVENRQHRGTATAVSAAAALREQVRDGRLDHDAVEAVLACAAQPVAVRPDPAGLTRRELEVLGLLARGLTNRQVARRLGITPKTVGNHTEHIYAKAGIGTRAAATLYAMEHGLL